jgi:hypothetical protein
MLTLRCCNLRRIEFLCHDINVHVPHHVSSNIPWYNLRAATDSLRQNWGQVCAPFPFCHPARLLLVGVQEGQWKHTLLYLALIMSCMSC